MLFQGQEFASRQPFTYFADHEGDLADAVHKGRLEFLSQFPELAQPPVSARLARPNDQAAFERCKLDRTDIGTMLPAWTLALHRDLLHLRRHDAVISRVGTPEVSVDSSSPTPHLLLIRYLSDAGQRLVMVNLADDYVSPMNDPLLAPQPGTTWTLLWSSEDPAYGGGGAPAFVEAGRWLIRGLSATIAATR
jgi:maltooligosyltrehalose trehalohydrolase